MCHVLIIEDEMFIAIGLIDATNPARPELVPAGKTMSLDDNARAQKSSERALCAEWRLR